MNTEKGVWQAVSLLVSGLALIVFAGCSSTPTAQPPSQAEPDTAPTEVEASAVPTDTAQPIAPEAEPTSTTAVATTEAPTTAPEPPEVDAAGLLEERCVSCHGLDRVTGARKTQDEWTQTVIRMVDRGADLNADEQALMIEYLAANYGP
ncbi:MAG: hypothetical protein GX620_04555 [Chloroflexi bacterium]|nr:hypothetical protein [Chloroflexota bacterium]